jgi:hypothetical protein
LLSYIASFKKRKPRPREGKSGLLQTIPEAPVHITLGLRKERAHKEIKSETGSKGPLSRQGSPRAARAGGHIELDAKNLLDVTGIMGLWHHGAGSSWSREGKEGRGLMAGRGTAILRGRRPLRSSPFM